MKIVRFVDGKMEFDKIELANFTALSNFPYKLKNDSRFMAYEKEGVCKMMMIDIDELPGPNRGDNLINIFHNIFGNFTVFHMYSGNGHHLYVPIKDGIKKEDFPHYKSSYLELSLIHI